ncbi:hypothetical protein D9M73_288630 [compost metagenome]
MYSFAQVRCLKWVALLIDSPMDQLQMAAESKDGSAQWVEAAHIVEGTPAAITNTNGVKNR